MGTPLQWIIRRSDFLIEVCDARFPQWTRNPRLEKRIQFEGRRYLLVFNKADAIPKSALESISKKYPNAFIISTRKRYGLGPLREFLSRMAAKREITVGVVGYPNTGKSSLINVLKGSHSARTSPVAGFTRGLQKLRITDKIFLWDTAGVVPFGSDETHLAVLGAKTSEQLGEPEEVALHILRKVSQENPEIIAKRYKVGMTDDLEELLGRIALATGKLKKGGVPNTELAAKLVVNDWQKDRLRTW